MGLKGFKMRDAVETRHTTVCLPQSLGGQRREGRDIVLLCAIAVIINLFDGILTPTYFYRPFVILRHVESLLAA
jgi:hypothetical protein